MAIVKFEATKLSGTGKEGILKPDADGYYTMPIGALNTLNSANEYYTADGAKQLFESSSILMRRIANGNLKGEMGHPKKLPGMSMDDFLNRIMTVEEKNVCCHYKEIWLDTEFGRNNPKLNNKDLIAIMAKIKPAGPFGPALKESFDNRSENVNFSIRAFTTDFYKAGKTIRVLKNIMTWDCVTEPGIATSNKWQSPSLEKLEEQLFNREEFVSAIEHNRELVTTEDSKEIKKEILNCFDDKKQTIQHLYRSW